MLTRILLALYPRSWRNQYGDEYCALLEDIGVNPSVALDAARAAFVLQLKEHRRVLTVTAVLVQIVISLWFCVHLHITDNMLWLPTTFLQLVGLCATYGPLLYLASTRLCDSKLRSQSK